MVVLDGSEEGAIEDYARFFKNSPTLAETEARTRGLLSRIKGQDAFSMARSAPNDIYSLRRAGKIALVADKQRKIVNKETMFRVSVVGLLAAILVVQIISMSRKSAPRKETYQSVSWAMSAPVSQPPAKDKIIQPAKPKTNVFDQFGVPSSPALREPFASTAKTNGIRLVFDKIVTRSGVVYQNVEIQKIEPDAITINYTLTNGGFGACKIPLAELPISLQQRFGYDPQNALAYENLKAQMAADYRAYQAELQNARLQLNYEIAKQRYDDFMKAEQADALQRMANAQEQQVWEQQRAADAQERQAETLDWLDLDLRK